MSRRAEGIPTTLLHNIKHNKVVHNCVVFLTIDVEETAHLTEGERYSWRELGNGIYRLVLRFGFMEEANIPEILTSLGPKPVSFNPMTTSYFLGRETLVPTKQPGMALLAIGSPDAERFHPTMSTEFLARIGDLVSEAIGVA
jgi:KUP system potassium uptake protein